VQKDKKIMRPENDQKTLLAPEIPEFIGHRIKGKSEPENKSAIFYEYIFAGNGVFVRAEREEFIALLPVCGLEIKGLEEEKPAGLVWKKKRIESGLWREILEAARTESGASEMNFREEVFAIFRDEKDKGWSWRRIGRDRRRSAAIADDSLPEYTRAAVEIHTHPPGAYHFSPADDRDESGKFRIFGILTDIHQRPKVRFRCGIYNHFVEIPARAVGEMPDGLVDLIEVETRLAGVLR
jgi:hypothetical protein